MSWSPQQDAALVAVSRWFDQPGAPQVFRLFGFAGTGKSTLAKEIAANVDGDVAFAAFTGKAALVMRRKGCHGASTIHGLIYSLDDEGGTGASEPKFVLNHDSELKSASLCIIDECSMVGAELAKDLLSFGVKVLVLGDPAQLPPVRDAGFFTDHKPDVMLTEVHRQARDNPIIRMSMDIRAGKRPEPCADGPCRVIGRSDLDPTQVLRADQVLVGTNRTRVAYNGRVRQLKGIAGVDPVVGDKLVCLRNDRTKRLFNGGLWRVASLSKSRPGAPIRMKVKSEDGSADEFPTEVKVHPNFFTGREGELSWAELKGLEQFTYGYALTVHKSQGSQWDHVMLFDESAAFRDDRSRWLYTGVTRAAETLTVVMP